ncbi:CHASE3 domain-containing protein [Rubrivivax sp. A210]|uniref:CHASE3 domain-containing protein n=1 Tax=Rubrivivax sp. A210 TaxID=2772301 RepID=UPI001918F531|nr:CHASE3 domain-containing protein [Rubrivivax sp. A210]
MKRPFQHAALAAIGLALAFLAGFGLFAWQSAARLSADGANLARVQRVLALLATLQASTYEAESHMRGHVLTGDPALLDSYRRAKDGVDARLAELRSTDAPSVERYERLIALGALLGRRFEGMAEAIALRGGRGGLAAVAAWEATGEGRRLDERVRAALTELQLHAEGERQASQTRITNSVNQAQGAALACSLAAMGIAGFALWRLQTVSAALRRARNETVDSTMGERRADSEWQRLFELALDAACLLDDEGRITRISAGGERLWGWSAQELTGRPAIEHALPEDQRRTEAQLAAITRGTAAQVLRNRWRRKDGSVVHLQWAAQWSPQDRSMVCVVRDISDSERLRTAVSRQVEALKSGRAELEQAVERADAAERLQAAFVAAVELALRLPAATLLARAGVLLHDDGATPPRQRVPLAALQAQAERLNEAVLDVLEYGALEADRVALVHEAFDVWEVLNETATRLRPEAERKGLGLALQLADDLGYARGDTRRVERLLRKLLHEAIAATAHGTVALHAKKQVREGNILIEVHDEAEATDDPAALFAPLLPAPDHAAGPSGTAPGPGLSVGLMLSQKLAQKMGGSLAARAGSERGRVFVLTLPTDEFKP